MNALFIWEEEMPKIAEVKTGEAYRFPTPVGDKILLFATGTVNSSGWSGIRLELKYQTPPPEKGVWEIDFVGDAPTGLALPVMLPVAATAVFAVPDWLKGFRVSAANNSLDIFDMQQKSLKTIQASLPLLVSSHTIVRHRIATYEDSWQPIGLCGGLSIKMKKLQHELTLVVEGPDEGKIHNCIQQSVGVGLIAAIIALYATGGGALAVAISAFLDHLKGCLGGGFKASIEDRSHWIEWCT